jgi:hypothetical protein
VSLHLKQTSQDCALQTQVAATLPGRPLHFRHMPFARMQIVGPG